ETLELTKAIIQKENIDCDLWTGYSFDVAMNDACARTWQETLNAYTADGDNAPELVEWISESEEAKAVTHCSLAEAAARFPAASLSPYKLAVGLLQLCIERYGLNLQTGTPVCSVESLGKSWVIKTDRGEIHSNKVIYATNAFTSTLLPEFEGKITSFRGQCAGIRPTKTYLDSQMLTHTYCFHFGPPLGISEAMIQRKDGTIILCGGRAKAAINDLLGQSDDSVVLSAISDHLKGALKSYLDGWGIEPEEDDERVVSEWSGIMGFTPESVPYVGGFKDKPGVFICAGHSGHGMARIMTCARGIAKLLQGASWSETGLPE
ncbi:hypothetical protein M422DRAFT_105725, partial [Sphaerobolus stellatus SS14]